MDPIRLEVFKHLFSSIADEMGVVLRRTGYSPNIKERRDYSCALFDAQGQMVAQGAHMPVHLGAMPMSVAAALDHFGPDRLRPGDVIMLNNPYRGGTHLPDISLLTPIFVASGELIGFAANRAHHADVGGMSPGSMPLSTELYQEGFVIPPILLYEQGRLNQAVWDLLLANVRTPDERAGDLRAQLASNHIGAARLQQMAGRYGLAEVQAEMAGLLDYAERMTRTLIARLPDGQYRFQDAMDDDGIDAEPAVIAVAITIAGDEAVVDFAGTSPQRRGSINATEAITLSAVYYVFRCLIGLDIPSNSGCLRPITVLTPSGTLVNARKPAAVAAGNVETSQRITDVLLGALAQAAPDHVPAASQGTMNNITIGGWDSARNHAFAYYETIGGGMGARPDRAGADAIHTHMTNTLNTPVEAMEYAYPFRMRRYEVRKESGGAGRFRGGHGIVREMELLSPARVTILSDRRNHAPYGLMGGKPGKSGRNVLSKRSAANHDSLAETDLPGKCSFDVAAGDVVRIETPGGGGWGEFK
ncbi:MAG: hydantoinase B/oxoprolinase family protein [Caldilineales bacterium]|nr:hydantoinase B/oxoprolinase family protein [Caldilineales bacterium]